MSRVKWIEKLTDIDDDIYKGTGFGARPNEIVLQQLMDGYGGRKNISCDKCGDTKVRDIFLRFDRIVATGKRIYCLHCVDECGCNG
jgi:hypothetical protein|tara:strand:+ start:5617 stop:5874 length:258 start_codon:yes stop_codon:yes gene_type:complete